MKKCTKCNKELSLDQFTLQKNKNGTKSYRTYCKKCSYEENKLRAKKWRQDNSEQYKSYLKNWFKENYEYSKKYYHDYKDGFHYVYYIPEHHYIGVTGNLKYRKFHHKNINKRLLNGFEIVYKTPSRSEALKVESKLHSMGYCG